MAAGDYTDMKPLFIPLMARWFDEFVAGTKTTEWRAFGPRWNHDTCIPGRAVIISRGYGKHARLHGTIDRVTVVRRSAAPRAAQEIFGAARELIAIKIRIAHPITRAA